VSPALFIVRYRRKLLSVRLVTSRFVTSTTTVAHWGQVASTLTLVTTGCPRDKMLLARETSASRPAKICHVLVRINESDVNLGTKKLM